MINKEKNLERTTVRIRKWLMKENASPGRITRTNMLEGIKMQKNKEIMSWLKNTWTKHRDNWITVAEMWGRRILLEWWPPVKRNGKTTPEILRMGEKEYLTNGIIREDNMKLEPRIFKRMGKIYRKNSSSIFKAENDDEKHHRNCWETPE